METIIKKGNLSIANFTFRIHSMKSVDPLNAYKIIDQSGFVTDGKMDPQIYGELHIVLIENPGRGDVLNHNQFLSLAKLCSQFIAEGANPLLVSLSRYIDVYDFKFRYMNY